MDRPNRPGRRNVGSRPLRFQHRYGSRVLPDRPIDPERPSTHRVVRDAVEIASGERDPAPREVGQSGNSMRLVGWRRRDLAIRTAFAALLVTMTWIGREFTDPDGGRTLWFAVTVGGIPAQYLLLVAVAACLLPAALRKPPISLERRLRTAGLYHWSMLAGVVLALTVAVAFQTGAPHPLADWRNFAVMGIAVMMLTRWLAAQPWKQWVLLDLAIAYATCSIYPLALWTLGGGPVVMGIRVPAFSGGNLQLASFAALVTFAAWLAGLRPPHRAYRGAVMLAAASSSLLVLLSFRRTYWLIWGLGICILLAQAYRRTRLASSRLVTTIVVAACSLAVVGALMGADMLVSRLQSFNPSVENQFTNTNQGHVNDVLDALDHIRAAPLFGVGIGRFYETPRLKRIWKEESFEVHNGPINAWLKFGFFGFLAYVGFHLRWIITMLRFRMSSLPGAALYVGTGVFLLTELLSSLAGPWPYAKVQLTIHHAVLLAAMLSVMPRRFSAGTRGLGKSDAQLLESTDSPVMDAGSRDRVLPPSSAPQLRGRVKLGTPSNGYFRSDF